jgi:diadenosine tetraphosphate (Ap4A) HIT family hydrolase
MSGCEFCFEFADASGRFRTLYGDFASSRIVARSENFVALPTLGQLFPGSLLVLPERHVETCAALPEELRAELIGFAALMTSRTRDFGAPVVFEHGAVERSGGGCGIHHAHLHIVPLPSEVSAETLFPEHMTAADDLERALRALGGADEYLLLTAGKDVLYSDVSGLQHSHPSQFFRRRLAEHFDLAAPWDWRAYEHIEASVLQMLRA